MKSEYSANLALSENAAWEQLLGPRREVQRPPRQLSWLSRLIVRFCGF